LALAACAPATPTPEALLLNLHNWPEYVNPQTLDDFRRDTGIFVNQTIFGSNEELLEHLSSGRPGAYDLIAPTDYLVRTLIERGLVSRLNLDQLPNLKNVQAEFRAGRPHDPEGAFSITKNWGTTGLIVKRAIVTEPVTRWADLWDLAPKYSGRIVVVEARDEVLGAALKLLGYSYNDNDPAHLAQAQAKLLALRPHIGISSDYFKMFQDGVVVLGIGWNGDAFIIREEYQTPVSYVIPAEGSLLWEDNWCVPAAALHPRNAHAFINYVLQPEIAAQEARYLGYATVVEPALALLDDALRTDPNLFPPPDVMRRLERLQPLDAEAVQRRDELWSAFIAG
jgi:spermidine/putrescine transport system substrate-binding protein